MEDASMSEELKTELNRRNFLAAAAALTCGCALSCPFAMGKDEDADDDDDEAVPPVKTGPVDVGALADFSKDGPSEKWIKDHHMIVVREGGKLYAITAICTHKQALLKIKDDQVYCPKHSSRFNYAGQPVPKPNGKIGSAKKPLSYFTISVNDKQHVIVDTSKPIDAAKAGDASAFVKVG
jgi:nitrite reductase/ring-hydroxylating ferredoxin subunit